MRVYRAIVWAEEVVPNRDPRTAKEAPFLITTSREQFFIQTSRQDDAVKAFKADLGKLAAHNAIP